MTNIRALLAVAIVTVLVVAACSDQSPGAPKTPPTPPAAGRGMVTGTVDAITNTVTFEPVGMASTYSGLVSPANYGNQGVTIQLYGTVDSVITASAVSKIWYIRIGFRNLETFPIGSNYTATSPPDTAGIFLFFYGGDPIVTSPAVCGGCTITLPNTMGTSNFNAPNEKYFWYHNRLQAKQSAPGSDTSYVDTSHKTPAWQFKANSDQVTGFRFTVMVNSDWPPPEETSWSSTWIAATDSLPDDDGEPDWQEYAVAGDAKLGIDTMRGSIMALVAPDSNSSIYMARHDSLGNMSARMDVVMQDSLASGQYQGVFGIVEPSGNKQAFIGVGGDVVDFVSFTEGTGVWSVLSGPGNCSGAPCNNTYTTTHLYSLRKFARDSVSLCVDGSRKLKATYLQLQPTQVSFNKGTIVFGTRSSTNSNKTSYWTSVNYWIGAGMAGTIASNGTCSP